MVRKIISPQEALSHINTLRFYNHFFIPWFGLNKVAKGEVAIRHLVILSILHHLIGKHELATKYKMRADKCMLWAIHHNVHITSPEKFELAKKSFDFYAWVFGMDAFYLKLNFLENLF